MTPTDRLGPIRRLLASSWAPVVVTLALAAVFVGRSTFSVRGEAYFTLADDAMVSMRYARNLAEGHGLVWNVGDAKVEGYSNLAWTLWMAVLHLFRLPDSKVGLLVIASGAALVAANVLAARRVAREIAPSSSLAISLAGFFVALDHSLAVWTLRGFEVGLCALTVTLGCLSTVRLARQWSPRTLAVLCGVASLSILTRDDMAPLWIGMAAYLAVRRDKEDRRTGLFGAGALVLGVFGTLGLHALYRWRTYGVPLPNTYYLKMGGASIQARWPHGARTLVSALLFCLPVGFVALFGAIKIPQFRRVRETWLLLGLFVMACLYSVHVGGDSLEHEALVNRFVSVTLPVFWVVVALAVDRLARAQGGLFWGRVAAVVAICAVYWNMHAHIPWSGADTLRGARTGAIVAAAWIAAWTTIRPGKWPPPDWLAPDEEPVGGGDSSSSIATSAAAGDPEDDTRSRMGAVSWPTLWRAVALVVVCQAPAWIWSFVAGPIWAEEGERVVRYALALGEATERDARIGVTWAGAIPYYSRRDAVDLFGKCDATIAKSPVHAGGLFAPGHNKWDLDHSIGALRPDVIAQLPADDARDLPRIEAWGYDRVGPEVFLRRGTEHVNREALIQAACVISWSRQDIWSYLGDPPEDWRARWETDCAHR